MSSYCLISEAWDNNFILFKNITPTDISSNTNDIKPNDDYASTEMELTNITNELTNKLSNKTNELTNKTNELTNKTNKLTDKTNELTHSNNESFTLDNLNKCTDTDCKELLAKILECEECQHIIYNSLKSKFDTNSSNINNILNSVFIGLFIIFILDTFVKIGKLFSNN